MGLRDALPRRRAAAAARAADPLLDALAAIAQEVRREILRAFRVIDYADARSAQPLLDAPREQQAATLLRLLEIEHDAAVPELSRMAAHGLAGELMRRKLPFEPGQVATWMNHQLDRDGTLWSARGEAALAAAERTCLDVAAHAELHAVLCRARDNLSHRWALQDEKRLLRRVEVLLGAPAATTAFTSSDTWSLAVTAALASLPDGERADAGRLLVLAATYGTAARPTKAFVKRRDALTAEIGAERAGALVAPLLAAAASIPATAEHGQAPPETGDVLRGLAVVAAATTGPQSAAALAALAIAGWRKVPGFGAQCRKGASGAIAALAEHRDGAAQLGRVKVRVTTPAANEDIARAIDRAAEQLGIPRARFEERVVPELGLRAGAREEPLGPHTARIALDGNRRFRLTFVTAKGRTVASVPADVKREHPQRLKQLRAELKETQAMFDAQRLRLERLLLDDPCWSAAQWREHYAEHGLVGPLARRLIWSVGDDSVVWHDGAWRRSDATAVSDVPDDAAVRLWHPAAVDAAEVEAWRAALEAWGITQPFKQAHREIYLLTPAERETNTYSNRFAAHVLRQHQMAALARARGWRYALIGAWDGGDDAASLSLVEQHGLMVIFYVDAAWGAENPGGTGVYDHVLTDQVRFEDAAGEPVAMRDVPPRILSETFRDVDLFVGVTSIGNDPAWTDGGRDRRYGAYWTSYSFGELSASAEVRKDVLARLLPKLKIADRAAIDGRYLVVAGRLRTYKIHLGSGNIRMTPNDEYLCIVPGGRSQRAERVYLPFEGDPALSLILSKAIMLADDDHIDDVSIAAQIRRTRAGRASV